MKNVYCLGLLATLIISANVKAESFRGKIYDKDGQARAIVKVDGQEQDLSLKIDQRYHKYMDKVLKNSPTYVFEFDGEISGDQLEINKMPRVVADLEDRIGTLTRAKDGRYYIDDQLVEFGRSKKIYGSEFDYISRHYFENKKVHTQGHMQDETFIINAIIPADLFSAGKNPYPANEKFNKNPLRYILKEMPKNKNSQSTEPFRGTIRHRDNYEATPGDHVFIVTLSGRQGDEPGAAAGHFAIGMGEVQNDLSIKGETFNFYFKGEKEVLASNTDLISYYGHLIQGQVNYRPTYTLIGYARSKEDMLKVRDIFEEQLHRVRTEEGLEITPFYNCTTTSNDTMRTIGIKGAHEFAISNIFDYQTYIPMSSKAPKDGINASTLSQLRYILKRDTEHYVPRKAFESFAKAMVYQSKRLKLKRTDYIFLPQTPSQRPNGGISYDEVLSEGKKIIDFKEERLLRLEREDNARKTLQNPNATAEQIQEAKTILNNAPTKEEDQKQISEILYRID
ncbi:hypothetical protein M902_0956 [Bacteriovorax sp. BAL6_X]|uniref:hypothetical protein n=1 Tax=Bacteriovorax sp. BAL6_X TaxID=1201290 RepID=UPI000385497B|nr:hypothetical protein [Bacteriovorax sp. BAL6_X]EPZ49372.1 hypothetical protein M902_0956 [Bacteriovorax sp. BAL6_X]